MLAAVEPRLLERVRFPLGEQTKEETREEAARAGLAAARRAESQEACFLGGDDYRAFLERQGSGASTATSSIGRGPARRARRLLEVHARSAARPRVNGGRRLYVLRTDAATNTVTLGSHDRLATSTVEARGRLHVPVTTRAVVSCATARRPCRRGRAGGRRLRARAPRARVRRRAAVSPRSSTTSDVVVGAGAITTVACPEQHRIRRDDRSPSTRQRLRLDYALSAFLVAIGAGLAYMLFRMGETFARLSSFIKGSERDLLPVIVKAGGTRRPRERPARQARQRDRQRGLDGGQRRHCRPRGLDRDHDAREEGQRPCRAVRMGSLRSGSGRASSEAVRVGEGCGSTPRERARRGARNAGTAEPSARSPPHSGRRPSEPRSYNPGMRTTAELREGFLSFFEETGPSALPVGIARATRRRRLDAPHDTPACSRRCRSSSAWSRRPRR